MSDLTSLRPYETANGSLPLKRYFPFCRFRQFMESGTLYFAPASTFDDDLEGEYTNRNHQAWDDQLARWAFSETDRERSRQAKAIVANHNKQTVVISCWTHNTEDSPRMWRAYGRVDDAVAMETTVARMRTALATDFLIIPVTYLDFQRESMPVDHSLVV